MTQLDFLGGMENVETRIEYLADWCGLCYKCLKIKWNDRNLLGYFEGSSLSQSGDGSSNSDGGGGTVN